MLWIDFDFVRVENTFCVCPVDGPFNDGVELSQPSLKSVVHVSQIINNVILFVALTSDGSQFLVRAVLLYVNGLPLIHHHVWKTDAWTLTGYGDGPLESQNGFKSSTAWSLYDFNYLHSDFCYVWSFRSLVLTF